MSRRNVSWYVKGQNDRPLTITGGVTLNIVRLLANRELRVVDARQLLESVNEPDGSFILAHFEQSGDALQTVGWVLDNRLTITVDTGSARV